MTKTPYTDDEVDLLVDIASQAITLMANFLGQSLREHNLLKGNGIETQALLLHMLFERGAGHGQLPPEKTKEIRFQTLVRFLNHVANFERDQGISPILGHMSFPDEDETLH